MNGNFRYDVSDRRYFCRATTSGKHRVTPIPSAEIATETDEERAWTLDATRK